MHGTPEKPGASPRERCPNPDIQAEGLKQKIDDFKIIILLSIQQRRIPNSSP